MSSPAQPVVYVDVDDTLVAGALFPVLVAALRPGGPYCTYGAAAGGDVSFDAWSLLEARTLTGYSTEDLNSDALRAATRELLAMQLRPPPTAVITLQGMTKGTERSGIVISLIGAGLAGILASSSSTPAMALTDETPKWVGVGLFLGGAGIALGSIPVFFAARASVTVE